jgi:hypothetical protein
MSRFDIGMLLIAYGSILILLANVGLYRRGK